jgi:hypothetical protein
MATLLTVLNNLADTRSAGGVALRVRTQDDSEVSERRRRSWARDEKRRIVEESLQEGAPIAEALDVMSSTPIDGTSGENSFIVFALA